MIEYMKLLEKFNDLFWVTSLLIISQEEQFHQ